MNIPIENIYFMLCYAWNKLDEAEIVNIKPQDDTEFVDLFARVLINGTKYLLRLGFDRNYISLNEDTRRLKGKINFADSMKRNVFIKAQANCSFDEFSYNVLHNQILTSTFLNLLNYKDLKNELQKEIFFLKSYFVDIEKIKIQKHLFNKIQLHSNNKFYDFLMKICELLFDCTMIEEKSGESKFKDFTRNKGEMAILFEEFVRNFYIMELKGANTHREDIFWYSGNTEITTQEFVPKMQTDISIQFVDRKCIIDTKFYLDALQEHYDKEKVRSAHLYQIFAYLKNLEFKDDLFNKNCEGILLYPKVSYDLDIKLVLHGHYIYFKTIDLNQHWTNIKQDLINIVMN